MSDTRFACILATVWLSSYRPDAFNLGMGALFAVVATFYFYEDCKCK